MAQIPWRCSYGTYQQFLDYWSLLEPLDPRTNEAKALIDSIRSLPGYPNDYDEDRDEIVAEPYKEHLL